MAGPYHDPPVFSRPGSGTRNYADVFRPLRTLISLALLAGMVWFSFAVELGDKTLAEHVDTISATPEAKQLLEGTRQTIDPALDDVRDRMLGEYVEAPTFIASDESPRPSPARERIVEADAPEPALPGRRRARPETRVDEELPPEPARPGSRLRPNVLASIGPAAIEDEGIEPARPIEPEPSVEPAAPVELPQVPWPRTSTDERSFLTSTLERVRNLPSAPEPTPIPIVHPEIDPTLPELPGWR
jgi:hypothetical protein